MPAPEGNINAAKEEKGVQVNFYLPLSEAKAIREKLIEAGEDATDKAVRLYARRRSMNGIALDLYGKCQIVGCTNAVEVKCDIPSQNGLCPGKFCSWHYIQIHCDEDERDEDISSYRKEPVNEMYQM